MFVTVKNYYQCSNTQEVKIKHNDPGVLRFVVEDLLHKYDIKNETQNQGLNRQDNFQHCVIENLGELRA